MPAAAALLTAAGLAWTAPLGGGSRTRLAAGEYAYDGGDHITAGNVAAGARGALEPEMEPPDVVVMEVAGMLAVGAARDPGRGAAGDFGPYRSSAR